MTEADRVAFDIAFRAVVRNHGNRDWTEQTIVRLRGDYFTALEMVPIAVVQEVSLHLVGHAKRWPKPVEWLDAVERTKRVGRAIPREVVLEDGSTETTFYCLCCEDTGWAPDCGCRTGSLDISRKCSQHPYTGRDGLLHARPVMACVCRDANPYWQANHPRRYSEERNG